jgi:hypothetical protein
LIRVDLSQKEIDLALQFVDEMRSDKENYHVTDRKFDAKNTSWAVNLMGHLGEKAVAKAYGVAVDDRVLTGGDEGYDLIINNHTVQVKTSVTNQLIFNSKELFCAQHAILVTLVGDRKHPHIDSHFIIHGSIARNKFLDICFEKDYGYGTRYVCNATDLSDEVFMLSKHLGLDK